MATNNILSFCAGANPNVTPLATWQTKAVRSSGFVSGIAISGDVNAAIVGGANIAHAVGEFIKTQLDEDVNATDDTVLVSQFFRALQVFIQRGGACPIGSIIPYLGGDVPYGWLLANGASVLRSQYNKLFALIGTKFGAVDEAHFNLPNLHHRFIEGTTLLSEVGSYVEAGLPNILGFQSHVYPGTLEATESGALKFLHNGNFKLPPLLSTDSGAPVGISLDASRVSSMYQNDINDVRVNALFGLHLIRAYQ